MAITQFGPNDAINEQSSARYTCTLTDIAGTTIADGAVSAIVATLVDAEDGTVINSRSAQSVLNVNGGTLSSGVLTLVLSTSDTIARGRRALQARRLTIKVTYSAGVLTHEIGFFVRSLSEIL